MHPHSKAMCLLTCLWQVQKVSSGRSPLVARPAHLIEGAPTRSQWTEIIVLCVLC